MRMTMRRARWEALILLLPLCGCIVVTPVPVAYPAEQLIAWSARRWNLELALRHVKTTMGMEQWRCQTPERVEKELLAYLVAYNLIRCLTKKLSTAAVIAKIKLLKIQGLN